MRGRGRGRAEEAGDGVGKWLACIYSYDAYQDTQFLPPQQRIYLLCSIQIHRRRLLDFLRLFHLLGGRLARFQLRFRGSWSWAGWFGRGAETHHAAHHVEERVALARDADPEVHLADLRQSVAPGGHLLQVRRVVLRELLIEVAASALDRQQEKSEEVEEG